MPKLATDQEVQHLEDSLAEFRRLYPDAEAQGGMGGFELTAQDEAALGVAWATVAAEKASK